MMNELQSHDGVDHRWWTVRRNDGLVVHWPLPKERERPSQRARSPFVSENLSPTESACCVQSVLIVEIARLRCVFMGDPLDFG